MNHTSPGRRHGATAHTPPPPGQPDQPGRAAPRPRGRSGAAALALTTALTAVLTGAAIPVAPAFADGIASGSRVADAVGDTNLSADATAADRKLAKQLDVTALVSRARMTDEGRLYAEAALAVEDASAVEELNNLRVKVQFRIRDGVEDGDAVATMHTERTSTFEVNGTTTECRNAQIRANSGTDQILIRIPAGCLPGDGKVAMQAELTARTADGATIEDSTSWTPLGDVSATRFRVGTFTDDVDDVTYLIDPGQNRHMARSADIGAVVTRTAEGGVTTEINVLDLSTHAYDPTQVFRITYTTGEDTVAVVTTRTTPGKNTVAMTGPGGCGATATFDPGKNKVTAAIPTGCLGEAKTIRAAVRTEVRAAPGSLDVVGYDTIDGATRLVRVPAATSDARVSPTPAQQTNTQPDDTADDSAGESLSRTQRLVAHKDPAGDVRGTGAGWVKKRTDVTASTTTFGLSAHDGQLRTFIAVPRAIGSAKFQQRFDAWIRHGGTNRAKRTFRIVHHAWDDKTFVLRNGKSIRCPEATAQRTTKGIALTAPRSCVGNPTRMRVAAEARTIVDGKVVAFDTTGSRWAKKIQLGKVRSWTFNEADDDVSYPTDPTTPEQHAGSSVELTGPATATAGREGLTVRVATADGSRYRWDPRQTWTLTWGGPGQSAGSATGVGDRRETGNFTLDGTAGLHGCVVTGTTQRLANGTARTTLLVPRACFADQRVAWIQVQASATSEDGETVYGTDTLGSSGRILLD